MKPVQPATTAYDYSRHGTTKLVAAWRRTASWPLSQPRSRKSSRIRISVKRSCFGRLAFSSGIPSSSDRQGQIFGRGFDSTCILILDAGRCGLPRIQFLSSRTSRSTVLCRLRHLETFLATLWESCPRAMTLPECSKRFFLVLLLPIFQSGFNGN